MEEVLLSKPWSHIKLQRGLKYYLELSDTIVLAIYHEYFKNKIAIVIGSTKNVKKGGEFAKEEGAKIISYLESIGLTKDVLGLVHVYMSEGQWLDIKLTKSELFSLLDKYQPDALRELIFSTLVSEDFDDPGL